MFEKINSNMFYTVNDSVLDTYHQLPKFLFAGVFAERLSSNDRLLYSVLKSMTSLSLKNNEEYADEKGRIFFFLNQQSIADEACISVSTVCRSMQKLEECGLIYKIQERKETGNFSICRYYLLKPDVENVKLKKDEKETIENITKSVYPTERQNDRRSDINLTDGGTSNCDTNNINIYNKNNIYNNQSINQEKNSENKNDRLMDKIDSKQMSNNEIEMFSKIVDAKIEWDKISQYYEMQTVLETRRCIIDVLTNKRLSMRISGTDYDIQYIRTRFLMLTTEHVLEVLSNVSDYHASRNPLGYLRTCLFNITGSPLRFVEPEISTGG